MAVALLAACGCPRAPTASQDTDLRGYLVGKGEAARKIGEMARDTLVEKEAILEEGRRYDRAGRTTPWAERLDAELRDRWSRVVPPPEDPRSLPSWRVYFKERFGETRQLAMRRAAEEVEDITREPWEDANLLHLATLKLRVVEARWIATVSEEESRAAEGALAALR
jgi:hypothetical protein